MDRRFSLSGDKAFSVVALLLTAATIVLAGCFAHTQYKTLEEIGAATIFYSGIFAILARRSQSRPDGWLFFVLLLTGFAITVHALSRNVETGIPALRTVFRASYHFYSIYILFSFSNRRDILQTTIESTLWLGSFLYLWSGVWNPAGLTPLTLALTLIAFEKRSDLELRALGLWREGRLISAAVVTGAGSLFAAWIVSSNSLQSLNQLQLYYAGGLIALLASAVVASKGSEAVLSPLRFAFFAFAILQVLAVALLVGENNNWTALFQKKLALAGLNANDAAGYLLLYFPVLAAELAVIRTRPFWTQCLIVLQVVVCLLLVFATGTRTAILLLGPLSLMLILLNARHRLNQIARRGRIVGLLLVGVAASTAVAAVAIWYNAGPERLSVWSQAMPHSLLERIALWSQGLSLIQQEPLFGTGPRNYAAIATFVAEIQSSAVPEVLAPSLQSAGVHQHMHNTLLQCALDGGVFFALAVLLSISFLAAKAADLGVKSWIGNGVAVASLGALLQGILNYHLMHLHYVATFATLAGLVAALQQSPKTNNHANYQRTDLSNATRAAVLVGLSITLYFVTLSAIHWQTVRNAGQSLQLTAHGNWSIIASDDPDFLQKTQNALDWARLGRRLAPYNPEFSQLEGSLLLAASDSSGSVLAAAEAVGPLQHCGRYGSSPAYCWALLAKALQVSNSESREQIEFAQRKAEALDPFKLLEKGYARPY